MRLTRTALLSLLLIAGMAASSDAAIRIDWDVSTLTLIQKGGVYGRMARLGSTLICCCEEFGDGAREHQGRCVTRQSLDEGKTWKDPVEAATYSPGNASNPELLPCSNGTLLLFYNGRPRDGVHAFTISMSVSHDRGATWTQNPRPIYEAGNTGKSGCYEPAAIQLPLGEIQLFFANEYPHRADGSQEISMMRSTDNAATWRAPQAVSYRAGHRDGMPVPIQLQKQKGIAFAIEDNGLTPDGEFKPTIIHSPANLRWPGHAVGGNDPLRMAAVDRDWPPHLYAGAPYLRQLPGGETVLSCQSTEAKKSPQMMVYLGDADAQHFTHASRPFPLDDRTHSMWNSLFVKNEKTITALSSTKINGVAGLWAIDGQVVKD